MPVARNNPFCPIPVKSKSTIAPVTLFTDVTVIVISLSVVAPPTSVPTIVSSSNLEYPVPPAVAILIVK